MRRLQCRPDPIAEELKEQYLSPTDCLSLTWPSEFKVLQEHVATRILKTLKAMANFSGCEFSFSMEQV